MADVIYMHDHREEGGWGVEPDDISLTVGHGNGKVPLTWFVNEKTKINGQTISEVAGIIFKRSTDHIPKNENDGTTILDTTATSGTFEDTSVTNETTYYYNAFPYSKHKVYNRNSHGGSTTPKAKAFVTVQFDCNAANGSTLTATQRDNSLTATVNAYGYTKGGSAYFELPTVGTWNISGVSVEIEELGKDVFLHGHVYGYDWLLPPAEADTESQISYPAGVNNENFGHVGVCGSDAEISVGDWQTFFDDFLKARPVMLNFDGTVAKELNHSDQTLNLDGTASNVANSSVTQNAMVELPKKYIKRTASDGYGHFLISEFKLSDDFSCDPWLYGSDRDTAVENDNIYLPMFEGGVVSSKLRSLSGLTPINTQTGATERTYAQACGSGWDLDDYGDMCLISDFMLMVAKSTNVQTHWGMGHYAGGNDASSLHTTGSLVKTGPFYGGTGNTNMKFMWMENWYGDRWERTLGCMMISSTIRVKPFPPYTTDGTTTNWTSLGHGIGGTSGGYISSVTYSKDGWAPSVASGADGKYLPDGAWFNAGPTVLLRGASCSYGARVGLAFSLDNPWSSSYWIIGASLTFKKVS